jgi:class 3 adenylate cyclase
VRAAARIQKGFAEHKNDAIPQPLRVRIGAAAGEPVERNNDLFGSTVQLAARLCAHAEPAQILVSSVIVELCLGKTLPFEDLGEVALKGFDKSVRIHAVAWS